MRADYVTTINQFDRVAILSAVGAVTPRGLFDAQNQLRALPEWRGDLDLLVVFQPGTTLDQMELQDIARHSDLFREWNAQHRTGPHPMTAVVTDSKIFNLACMIWATLRRDDWKVDVAFHTDEAAAMRWIRASRARDEQRSERRLELAN